MVAQLRVSLLLLNRLCEEWEGTAVRGSRYGGPHWGPPLCGDCPDIVKRRALDNLTDERLCVCVCVCALQEKESR
jgi:hypothetical protein